MHRDDSRKVLAFMGLKSYQDKPTQNPFISTQCGGRFERRVL